MKLKQTFAVLLAAGALVLTACTPRGAASSSATATAARSPPKPRRTARIPPPSQQPAKL